MAADGGTRAVVVALGANLGIAASKFVAAAITGSASMLAEGVHSVADSGNQVLLLVGGARARRAPSQLHPFGYARERYIYAFLVAVVLFTLGGLYALYEGYHKLTHPEELTSPAVALAVLAVAITMESAAMRTAIREANKVRGGQSWWGFIRHARAPELPVILLEDSGALVGLVFALFGVGLTVLTGNPVFDGIGTLAIGLLLVVIAVVLATEVKSLLIGEAALPHQVAAIERALLETAGVQRVIHLRTVHLGPEELLVAAKIAVDGDDEGADIAGAIDAAEARVRAAVPTARMIYLEPDIYRPPAPRREGTGDGAAATPGSG
ncbi:MAG TPA: cation diffusion facilitator family transporter [Natronosporangium sp.]|nr:cation diffusion facilitator family transporter [Natronosporangium sp.]